MGHDHKADGKEGWNGLMDIGRRGQFPNMPVRKLGRSPTDPRARADAVSPRRRHHRDNLAGTVPLGNIAPTVCGLPKYRLAGL